MGRAWAVVLAGVLCCCCRLLWAQDAAAPEWDAPQVEMVRMPAGIRAGVYYPEHDELVFVRPGAWKLASTETLMPPQEAVPVRITLSGQVKLSDAVKDIARAQGLRLVMGAGVEDREVALDFHDAAPQEALKGILHPLGYGFKVDPGELLVLARDTRIFRIVLPPVAQAFSTSTSNESSSSSADSSGPASSREGRMRVGARVQVENAVQGLSYWQDMEANIKGLLSSGGAVSFNRSAGVAVVTDTVACLDRIGALVQQMNADAGEQIVVDVKVVEVALSREHKLGIDWAVLASAGSLKALGLSTNLAAENMGSGHMITFSARADKEDSGDASSGVKAVLKALESFGRVDMLSQPKLVMLNNAVASIQVGQTRSYVETADTQLTQSGSTITSASLNQVHGGVALQIIGSVAGDDIFLNVTPVVSTIDGIRTIALGGGAKLEAPDTSIKTISTQVRVKAGQTVAIGGLISRESAAQRHGIPLLSRIPVVGRAFSYDVRRSARTELVIFMTPSRG